VERRRLIGIAIMTAGAGKSGAVTPLWSLDGLLPDSEANPERDCIIQPRVARNELPWVSMAKLKPTLKGLNQGSAERYF
jgi:hypothetical protein